MYNCKFKKLLLKKKLPRAEKIYILQKMKTHRAKNNLKVG